MMALVQGDGNGWVRCGAGHRHWGRHGAAGLLLRDRQDGRDRVLLQHRAGWSHHGDTWGLPGGARDSHESAVAAALREAAEETTLDPTLILPSALLVDDHGGWTYLTVLAQPTGPMRAPEPAGRESEAVSWVDVGEVQARLLHPGFAATWPLLRDAAAPLTVLVDGANVVGAAGGGDGWWRDRAGAARRLATAMGPIAVDGVPVAELPGCLDLGDVDVAFPRLVLVVEGAAGRVADEVPPGPVVVVAAEASGDDTIVALAGDNRGRPTLVVTADRELRVRATRAGTGVAGPRWLLGLIRGTRGGLGRNASGDPGAGEPAGPAAHRPPRVPPNR